MMDIGDLVTWSDDESQSSMPWYYHNWKEIGIVIGMTDLDTVVIYWSSSRHIYPVWLNDLKILSSTSLNKKLNLS
jgi:hypothetical protein